MTTLLIPPFIVGQSWISACVMAVLVGLAFLLGSCVAHKVYSLAALRSYTVDTKNYKKLLYGTLSLMAISLFALSGDVHYSKSSTTTWEGNQPQAEHQAILFDLHFRKKAASVALLCIFMVIYAVGVRHPVAVLEDCLIGQRTGGTGTVMYKAISTTTHWLTVPLLIRLFLLNWGHIGFGWMLVLCATVCLLTIMYVAVFIPDDTVEVIAMAADGDNGDPNVIIEAARHVTAV